MDVKTAFLNGDLHEDLYMAQSEGFAVEGQEHMFCKFNKSIYGLKQASRQWYIKFDNVIWKFGFTENKRDNCIHIKIKGSKFNILVLYVGQLLQSLLRMECLWFALAHVDMCSSQESSGRANQNKA